MKVFKVNRYSFIKLAYIMIDVVFMMLAIYIACQIRSGTLYFLPTFHNIFLNPDNPFRALLFFWVPVTIFTCHAYGLYETKREKLESVEIFQVFRAVLFSAFASIIVIYALKIEGFPRTILGISTILVSVFFSLWRVLKRAFVEYLVAKGFNNFNALIIGAGKVGATLEHEIRKRKTLGIRVAGYLDDFKTNADIPTARAKILGKISDFAVIAKKQFIHQVYITIHHDSAAFVKVLEDAKEMGIAVRVVPQGFELLQADFMKYNIGIIPVLEYSVLRNIHRHQGKRLFDLCISWFLLIALLPFLLILAVAVKIDSPGPVLYLSKRYGRRGQLFPMYKFRTMVKNADELLKELKARNEVDGPIFKMKRDPRLTRVGSFLRKYSLDELPQILNVINGEMSLVGPRPLPIEQIEREDFRQLKRLDIRPGMTGLWQIRGRSDLSFQRLVKWDIWYINNWSFWLDLHILLQTLPVVLKGRGAY
jgi:exopolysaccharide biosynthesis polyprenyl glycosylphosphotransferase